MAISLFSVIKGKQLPKVTLQQDYRGFTKTTEMDAWHKLVTKNHRRIQPNLHIYAYLNKIFETRTTAFQKRSAWPILSSQNTSHLHLNKHPNFFPIPIIFLYTLDLCTAQVLHQ